MTKEEIEKDRIIIKYEKYSKKEYNPIKFTDWLLDQLVKERTELKQDQDWISVKDSLPDEYGLYETKSNKTSETTWNGSGWAKNYRDITHYKPKQSPEPAKQEKECKCSEDVGATTEWVCNCCRKIQKH